MHAFRGQQPATHTHTHTEVARGVSEGSMRVYSLSYYCTQGLADLPKPKPINVDKQLVSFLLLQQLWKV